MTDARVTADEFHAAWWWLLAHPLFTDAHGIDRFHECLSIEVMKVNPESDEVDDDRARNTRVAVWLEAGTWVTDADYTGRSHDDDLDCGAPTFEGAIVELAALVRAKYGEGGDDRI